MFVTLILKQQKLLINKDVESFINLFNEYLSINKIKRINFNNNIGDIKEVDEEYESKSSDVESNNYTFSRSNTNNDYKNNDYKNSGYLSDEYKNNKLLNRTTFNKN